MKGDIEYRDGGALTIHLAEDGSEPDENGILTMVTVRAFDEIRRLRKRVANLECLLLTLGCFDYLENPGAALAEDNARMLQAYSEAQKRVAELEDEGDREHLAGEIMRLIGEGIDYYSLGPGQYPHKHEREFILEAMRSRALAWVRSYRQPMKPKRRGGKNDSR